MAVPHDLDLAVGKAIRHVRREHGLSQEELGFACGRHRTYISLLERGKNSPSTRTLWMIADALGIKASSICLKAEDIVDDGSPV